jgi:crossover junction endodeoxyribonuclease RuvC
VGTDAAAERRNSVLRSRKAEALVDAERWQFEMIEASAWKRFFHLHAGDKEGSRQLALQRFPSAHALLARRKDHNKAESMLIALFASARAGRIAA